MTETSPLASASTPAARNEDAPQVWNRPKTTFVSTCPKCGYERSQHGYNRRMLLDLLDRRGKIDAYCLDCKVCWPISESERRSLSPQLNTKPESCEGTRSAWCSRQRKSRDPNWRGYRNPPESETSLQQAVRTLRAIRLRYEIDRRNSGVRLNSLLVSLSCSDMLWVDAAVEALEKAIAAG